MATPMTAVTVTTSGTATVVLTSPTGDYDIDSVDGVIHVNVNPPLNVQNGGPDDQHTYTVRGTVGGVNPVAFVGMIYVGTTSTGIAKFSYNMS